jgi:hypothetical protein
MIGLPAAGAPIPGLTRPPGTGTAPMAPIAPAMRAPFAPAPPPAAAPVVPFVPPAPPPRQRTLTPTPPPAPPPPAPAPRARLATPAPPPAVAPPVVVSPSVVTQSPLAQSALTDSIDQKLAAISARGPEYEAIAKLSREVIEQVVWEVVPELAEAIIREHLQKSGRLS